MLTFSRRTTTLTGAAAVAAAGCTLAVALPGGAHAHAAATQDVRLADAARTASAVPAPRVAPRPALRPAAPKSAKPTVTATRKPAPKPAPAPVRRPAAQAVSTHRAATRTAAPATDYSGLSPRQIAARVVPAGELASFDEIISHESGWDVTATNPSSGAYGLGQALPGSKMAAYGADWQTGAATQIKWALAYMDSRYGSPNAAWSFWQAHNWY